MIISSNNVSKQSNAVDATPKLGEITPGVFVGIKRNKLWVSLPTVCFHTTGGVCEGRTGPLGLPTGLGDVEEDDNVEVATTVKNIQEQMRLKV